MEISAQHSKRLYSVIQEEAFSNLSHLEKYKITCNFVCSLTLPRISYFHFGSVVVVPIVRRRHCLHNEEPGKFIEYA